MACRAAACNLLSRPPQILNQNDLQRYQDHPKLPDGERLNFLMGVDLGNEDIGVETAVGMRDKRPSRAEDAWITRDRGWQPRRHPLQAKERRRNRGTFTRSMRRAKTAAAPSALATTHNGKGAIAIPATARTQAIEVSATDEATSHELGREDQMRRRSRLL